MYGMLSGQQSGLPLFHPLQQQQQQQGLLNTHHHHHCSSLLKNSNSSSSSSNTACCKSSSVVCCCWESASASSGTVAGLLLEPTSVLDIRSPSPNNSRALSSSLSAEAAVSSSTKAVSSSSSSSREDCVGAAAAPADQELDEFRAGELPVAELQQVYGLYEGQHQQQQQQQQGVLPLFYSGQGIRQIESAIGVEGIVGEGFEQRLGDFVRNGGAAADWGSGGSSSWLQDLVLGVDHHPRQHQQQQQLEELESELLRCPSSPPPPTDSSSLMRWLLGGDGPPGAGATAGDIRNPWQQQQQQQQVMGMIVKQEQEAIHDQWSQHHQHQHQHQHQPQPPLGFHHPPSSSSPAFLSSSIPPHLAHLESFTRRTLPLSSPHPTPNSASLLYHSSPPVMEGLVDSKPFNPFSPYQQQQRDPFMAGMMQQQQHSLFGGGGGGLVGILGGSRPHSATLLDYQVRPAAASPLHLVQQQQLRDLQAGLSSKRAFEEQQQQLLLRSQQQLKRGRHQSQGRQQQQYEHQQQPSSKLARLSSANAPTGHLLQQQQWSPGDDVGGRGSESSFVNKLLVQAAEAFESGLDELAQSILARLNDHHQQQQQQQQQQAPALAAAHRISFMFRDVLLARISDRKTRCQGASAAAAAAAAATGETCSASASALEMFEQVGAFKSLCEASPVLKFAHFTANQAIAEAMEAEEQVHILDLSEAAAPSSSCSSFGGQWSSYVMSSSQPQQQQQQRIRVTLVGTREESLCFAVESLQEFASGYYRGGTGFEFRGVLVEPGRRLDASELGILPGEAVAVNFVFGLHRMLLAEVVEPVLASVRGLNPKIVTLVEQELDTDSARGAPFASRFREGLDYYCALAESVSRSSISIGSSGQWDKVEQLVWKPEIEGILLGRQKHHKLQQWRARMGAAGFSCSRLSEACERQAECLLGSNGGSSSSSSGGLELVKDEDGSLLVGFQGKLLASASAWKCC